MIRVAAFVVLAGLAFALGAGIEAWARRAAERAALEHGLNPASVTRDVFALCMRGRTGFSARTYDGRRAKICVGGLMPAAVSLGR